MPKRSSTDSRSKKGLRKVIKKLGGKPAVEKIKKILDRAYVSARSVPLYAAPESHLASIGCTPEDAPAYHEQEARVLKDLYLAARTNTSRLKIKGLALQYALDARKPVEDDDILGYRCWRGDDHWIIRHCPDALTTLGVSKTSRRTVDWMPAVEILDCAFGSPRRYDLLPELIEVLRVQVPIEGGAPNSQTPTPPGSPTPRRPGGVSPDIHAHFVKEARVADREKSDSEGWFPARALGLGDYSRRTRTRWLGLTSRTRNSFLESNGGEKSTCCYRIRRPRARKL